ncbi:MAG: DUF3471 domain-containing protein, partial [Acidobacteria bacterium]|nr:DUF3471 domain-containing protein [Acidobacteriota bacterium]
LLTDKKVGVYVFGNVDHAEVRHALMYKAFDLFAFNDDSRDWSAEFLPLYDGIKKQGEKARAARDAARQKNTKMSLPLEDYAGHYHDQFHGNVEIRSENGKLRLIMSPELQGDLTHWHYDTFEVKLNRKWYGKSLISFNLNPITRNVESVSYGGVRFAKKRK